MNKSILATLSLVSVIAFPALVAAQTQSTTTFEKKSYNYAEWAKGRFSEVVTIRNPGKIIYLGGIGSEDEDSAQGGAIRHLGDFGAQCRYAWDKIKRLLAKHDATLVDTNILPHLVTSDPVWADWSPRQLEAAEDHC